MTEKSAKYMLSGCQELEAQKRTLSQFRKLKKNTLCQSWTLKKGTLSSGTSPVLASMECPPPPPPGPAVFDIGPTLSQPGVNVNYFFKCITRSKYTYIYNLYPLQVGNCDSNARLVVGEDFIGEYRLERVNEHVQYELKTLRSNWIETKQ